MSDYCSRISRTSLFFGPTKCLERPQFHPPSSREWGCPIPCAWEHLKVGGKMLDGMVERTRNDIAKLHVASFCHFFLCRNFHCSTSLIFFLLVYHAKGGRCKPSPLTSMSFTGYHGRLEEVITNSTYW